MEARQVSKVGGDSTGIQGTTGDEVAQRDGITETGGENLIDVELVANENVTTEADVERDMGRQQRQHEANNESIGFGSGGLPNNPGITNVNEIRGWIPTNLFGFGSSGLCDNLEREKVNEIRQLDTNLPGFGSTGLPDNPALENAIEFIPHKHTNFIKLGFVGLGNGDDVRRVADNNETEEVENGALAVGEQQASEEGDSTEEKVEPKAEEEVNWQSQREDEAIHANKDDCLGIDSLECTAKETMVQTAWKC